MNRENLKGGLKTRRGGKEYNKKHDAIKWDSDKKDTEKPCKPPEKDGKIS